MTHSKRPMNNIFFIPCSPLLASGPPAGLLRYAFGLLTAGRSPRRLLFFVFGMFPALFEMRLPVFRPRPAEVIDESFISGDELRRSAAFIVDDRALNPALNECVSLFFVVGTCLPDPRCYFVKRLFERLWIIECRIGDNLFSIRARRKHLDGLQLITELKH